MKFWGLKIIGIDLIDDRFKTNSSFCLFWGWSLKIETQKSLFTRQFGSFIAIEKLRYLKFQISFVVSFTTWNRAQIFFNNCFWHCFHLQRFFNHPHNYVTTNTLRTWNVRWVSMFSLSKKSSLLSFGQWILHQNQKQSEIKPHSPEKH